MIHASTIASSIWERVTSIILFVNPQNLMLIRLPLLYEIRYNNIIYVKLSVVDISYQVLTAHTYLFFNTVPDPCLSTPCDPNAECTRDGLQLNTFTCFCITPYEGNGFNCICKLSTRESA